MVMVLVMMMWTYEEGCLQGDGDLQPMKEDVYKMFTISQPMEKDVYKAGRGTSPLNGGVQRAEGHVSLKSGK